mgnify:CR=1 FL=1
MSRPGRPPDFDDEEVLRSFLKDRGSLHECPEADCQVYPDNTRRRNPYPGEKDANALLPPLPDGQRARDPSFRRPPIPPPMLALIRKYRRD